jgi:hypothetical protein
VWKAYKRGLYPQELACTQRVVDEGYALGRHPRAIDAHVLAVTHLSDQVEPVTAVGGRGRRGLPSSSRRWLQTAGIAEAGGGCELPTAASAVLILFLCLRPKQIELTTFELSGCLDGHAL